MKETYFTFALKYEETFSPTQYIAKNFAKNLIYLFRLMVCKSGKRSDKVWKSEHGST